MGEKRGKELAVVGNMNCVDQSCVVRRVAYKDNVRVGTGLVGKLQVGRVEGT